MLAGSPRSNALLAAAITALLGAVSVAAICDVCGIRNEHTKDYSTPFEPGAQYPACQNYREAACCDLEAVEQIAAGYKFYDSSTEIYNMAACDNAPDRDTFAANYTGMSAQCRAYFEAEYCFYECDVNTAKYRRHLDCLDGEDSNGWELYKMPIKASYCDAWFQACKDDYFCSDFSNNEHNFFVHAALNADGNCTFASKNCRTIGEIYGSGEGICEKMWGDAFLYDSSNEGYVMNFPADAPNPNDAVFLNVTEPDPCPDHDVNATQREAVCSGEAGFAEPVLKPCEVCHLRNDHTADIAKPRPAIRALDGPCSKYADNACCTVETVETLHTDGALYGETAFRWDKCYRHHPSLNATVMNNATLRAAYDRCASWFTVEECLYECDVNAGKWRKEIDCADSTGSNGWQISSMPLRASECDAFYDDCKELRMCTCTGSDCPPGLAPFSLFGSAEVDDLCANSTDYCRTIGEVWSSPKEWCELLWDNSFRYEEHEAAAYSMAWNHPELAVDDFTYASNPNNKIIPDRAFPPNCPSHDATVEMCTEDGSIASPPAETQAAQQEATGESQAPPPPSAACSSSLAATILVAVAALLALQ